MNKHRRELKNLKKQLRYEKVKFVVEFLLKYPCSICSEKDPLVLDFDHLGNKECNIGYMISNGCSLDDLKKEIKKCQVLCANCHRRKTAKEKNHYRYKILQEIQNGQTRLSFEKNSQR